MTPATNAARQSLNERLETIAWGLGFLSFGIFAIVPGDQEDAWLTSLGAILLGLNAARLAVGIPMSWLTAIVGALAVGAGAGSMAGVGAAGLGLASFLLGLAVVVRAVVAVRAESAATQP